MEETRERKDGQPLTPSSANTSGDEDWFDEEDGPEGIIIFGAKKPPKQ